MERKRSLLGYTERTIKIISHFHERQLFTIPIYFKTMSLNRLLYDHLENTRETNGVIRIIIRLNNWRSLYFKKNYFSKISKKFSFRAIKIILLKLPFKNFEKIFSSSNKNYFSKFLKKIFFRGIKIIFLKLL